MTDDAIQGNDGGLDHAIEQRHRQRLGLDGRVGKQVDGGRRGDAGILVAAFDRQRHTFGTLELGNHGNDVGKDDAQDAREGDADVE